MATTQGTPAVTEAEEHLLQPASAAYDRNEEQQLPQLGRSPFVRSWLQSIGPWNIVLLSTGLFASSITSVYLSLVWLWSADRAPDYVLSRVWRDIIVSNSLSVSVTISAAVVRTSLALQAGVALSMVAAVMLEGSTVPLKYAPLFISLRGFGVSTSRLLECIWSTFRSAPLLNLYMAVLIVATLASQLASTLLVSDLRPRYIANNIQQVKRYTEKLPSSESPEHHTTQYWFSGLTEYPAFAEYAQLPPNEVDWKLDTGPTIRAFPPIQSSNERRLLSSYDGYSAIFDTRFSCMPIEFEGGFTSHTVLPFSVFFNGRLRVVLPSHIQVKESATSRERARQTLDLRVNCSLTLASPQNPRQEWAISICDSMDAIGKMRVRMPSPLADPRSILSQPPWQYIILNTTGTYVDWQEASRRNATNWVLSTSEPWSITSWSASNASVSLAMSYCIGSFKGAMAPSTMTGGVGRVEPVIEWDSRFQRDNVTAVARLYAGAVAGYSPRDRGILDLKRRSNWTEGMTQTTQYEGLSYKLNLLIEGLLQGLGNDISMALCSYCDVYAGASLRAHRRHSAVFQHVLKSTESLPLAMQSLWTILAQMAYYDYLSQFDLQRPTTTSSFSEHLVPARVSGLITFIVLVVVQNVSVGLVLLLFLRRTRLSLIGNLWQGLGQIVAGDIAEVASKSTTALDEEVVSYLEKEDLHKVNVKLVYDAREIISRLERV
ncbi:Fc.00g056550.m01.CDS01 [Cosmosporella sp. VM-42]